MIKRLIRHQHQHKNRGKSAAASSSAAPAQEAPDEVPAASAEAPPPDDGQPVEFDEEWYLGRYPDVARSVSEGHLRSGLEHYLRHGCNEGRLPVPPKQES